MKIKTTNEDENSPLISTNNSKDQIVNVIGDIGWWQIEKSLIVFVVSIPGLAHIFLTPFLMPKSDFWCEDSFNNETLVRNYIHHIIMFNTELLHLIIEQL